MDRKTPNRITEQNSTLIENLVARFPMSCVCFQTVLDHRQKITDFIILHVNAGFETIMGIKKESLAGRTVSDALGSLDMDFMMELFKLANKAYHRKEQSCEVKARVFAHIYKVSFLFISDIHLLVIFEDIHAKYFRKHYHRSIPRDVVTTSISKSKNAMLKGEQFRNVQAANAHGFHHIPAAEEIKPLEIIGAMGDFSESYDAVFRDSLTGLYNRCFAVEALRMYVDSNVLPLSVALGNVNGLKTINESMGFHAGDEILIKISDILLNNCRKDDVVTRWNDGEFMLLLPHASQEEVRHIIKRMQIQLNAICGDAYSLVTFGYATSETQCRKAEDLIQEAERWVHQKKLLINQSHRSSIIRLLLSMLHEKSSETEEHSDRMANHCRWIAKKMDLSDELLDDLILLSILHDIGKIGIPDDILNKPGPLTDQERIIINRHPEIGHRIAQTVPELKQVAGYILAHHEKWDGTGYPKGLRGEEIPIASRIIAVVDAYDVIVTGRKYRAPRSREEAIAELQRCAGTQFDPHIVSLYVKMLANSDEQPGDR